MSESNPKLLTIKGLCERYSVTRTRAYNMLADGKIAAVRLDGRTLVRTDSADAFFDALPAWTPESSATA